jgi:hypothetical protein
MLNVLLTAVLSMELHLLFRNNVLRIGEIFPTGRWTNIPAIHQTYSNSITSLQSKLQPVCFSYHDLFGQKRIGCVDEEWRGIVCNVYTLGEFARTQSQIWQNLKTLKSFVNTGQVLQFRTYFLLVFRSPLCSGTPPSRECDQGAN